MARNRNRNASASAAPASLPSEEVDELDGDDAFDDTVVAPVASPAPAPVATYHVIGNVGRFERDRTYTAAELFPGETDAALVESSLQRLIGLAAIAPLPFGVVPVAVPEPVLAMPPTFEPIPDNPLGLAPEPPASFGAPEPPSQAEPEPAPPVVPDPAPADAGEPVPVYEGLPPLGNLASL